MTETIAVDQLGDISIPINYPPHASIQKNPAGDFEYHVSPQIEGLNENGVKVPWIGGDLINAPARSGREGRTGTCSAAAGTAAPAPRRPRRVAARLATGSRSSTGIRTRHGIAPDTPFKSIFTQYPTPPADVVWYFALDGGGGPGVQGALLILRRAAAAAYLNAAKLPDFGATPAQVVAAVNTAVATNNRNTILALATLLDNANNRGCPLN